MAAIIPREKTTDDRGPGSSIYCNKTELHSENRICKKISKIDTKHPLVYANVKNNQTLMPAKVNRSFFKMSEQPSFLRLLYSSFCKPYAFIQLHKIFWNGLTLFIFFFNCPQLQRCSGNEFILFFVLMI